MEFRILGPLEVLDGGGPVEIAGSKRRAVLALLLLHANEVVRTERLIDDLWGDHAPRNAAAALHSHVSRLRKALGPDVLVRREWGYVLRINPDSFDLGRFERLVADARPLPARERAAKLAGALELWRGPALADLGGEEGLRSEIARLDELRLAILERRIDADLEAGRNADLVAEIEALVAAHPLRERLRGQLILALYRAGRQVEALEVYRETRRVLSDELGLEPSPELRDLERAILRQDPALAGAPVQLEANSAQPPPSGRRARRLYYGAVAVLLLGALAAIAALLALEGTGAAKHAASSASHVAAPTTTSASHVVAQTATTTIVRTSHRTVHRANSVIGVHHTVHAANKPNAVHSTASGSPEQRSALPTSHAAAAPITKKKSASTNPKTPTESVRISDAFNDPAIDPLTWNLWNAGSGGTATEQNGELVFSLPASPSYDSQFHQSAINVGTKCTFPGDFDARVDFTLLNWPAKNGAWASLVAYRTKPLGPIDEISRISDSYGERYNNWPGRGSLPLADNSGSFRIDRSSGVLRSYALHYGQWKPIASQTTSGPIWIGMSLWTWAKDWQHMPITAAFDNFKVTATSADCPTGSQPSP